MFNVIYIDTLYIYIFMYLYSAVPWEGEQRGMSLGLKFLKEGAKKSVGMI